MKYLTAIVLLFLFWLTVAEGAVVISDDKKSLLGELGCNAMCIYKPENLAQLVACIATARMGTNFALVHTCGVRKEHFCVSSSNDCVWVESKNPGVRRKFGTGSCLPITLVPDPVALVSQLAEFKDLIETSLPAHAIIVGCLFTPHGSCRSPTCLWCDSVANEAHRGRPASMGVCLPPTMHSEFCTQFKNTTAGRTLCAREALIPTGCRTGCTYQPKNLAQLAICIFASQVGGNFGSMAACGVMVASQCKKRTSGCVFVEQLNADSVSLITFGLIPVDGYCLPDKFTKTASGLIAGLTKFFPLVKGPHDQYSAIIICLAMAEETECDVSCKWCGGIPSTAYPGPSPLTGLCVPTKLKAQYCEDIQKTAGRTLCQKVGESKKADSKDPESKEPESKKEAAAMELISTTGCKSGCVHKPKNLAQLVACIAAVKLGGDFSFLIKGGDKKEADCTAEGCNWVALEADDLKAMFGAGFCVAKKITNRAKNLIAVVSKFASLVETTLPPHTDLLTCLKTVIEGDCQGTCEWCGKISETAYPGKPPLKQLCLPKSVAQDICKMLKEDEKKLELCSGETLPLPLPLPSQLKPSALPSQEATTAGAPSSAPLISCMTPLCLWLLFHN